MTLAEVLWKNFLTFDYLIFVMGVINFFFMLKTLYYSHKLFKAMNPDCWIPGGLRTLSEIEEKFEKQSDTTNETELILLRRKTNFYYVFYENITTIFPLMGMLGTVVSLIPMVSEMGEVAAGYFFSALTSTLWGIIFAILFKALNGYLSAQIDDNEKNMEVFLARNTSRINARRNAGQETASSDDIVNLLEMPEEFSQGVNGTEESADEKA